MRFVNRFDPYLDLSAENKKILKLIKLKNKCQLFYLNFIVRSQIVDYLSFLFKDFKKLISLQFSLQDFIL